MVETIIKKTSSISSVNRIASEQKYHHIALLTLFSLFIFLSSFAAPSDFKLIPQTTQSYYELAVLL